MLARYPIFFAGDVFILDSHKSTCDGRDNATKYVLSVLTIILPFQKIDELSSL